MKYSELSEVIKAFELKFNGTKISKIEETENFYIVTMPNEKIIIDDAVWAYSKKRNEIYRETYSPFIENSMVPIIDIYNDNIIDEIINNNSVYMHNKKGYYLYRILFDNIYQCYDFRTNKWTKYDDIELFKNNKNKINYQQSIEYIKYFNRIRSRLLFNEMNEEEKGFYKNAYLNCIHFYTSNNIVGRLKEDLENYIFFSSSNSIYKDCKPYWFYDDPDDKKY